MTAANARCSRCDEVVGTVVTDRGRATIRLTTSSHGDDLPISCPQAAAECERPVKSETDAEEAEK